MAGLIGAVWGWKEGRMQNEHHFVTAKVSGLMQGLSLAAKTFFVEALREKDSFDSRTVSQTH